MSRVGYSPEFRRQHEAEMAERQRQRDAQMQDNEDNRQRRLAALEAERRAKAQDHEAEIEAALEPRKQQLKRQWLVDHPDRSDADFERHAWPKLCANLVADDEEAATASVRAGLLRSGQYGI